MPLNAAFYRPGEYGTPSVFGIGQKGLQVVIALVFGITFPNGSLRILRHRASSPWATVGVWLQINQRANCGRNSNEDW